MSDNAEITRRLRAAGGDPSRPLPPTPRLSPAADRRAAEQVRRDPRSRRTLMPSNPYRCPGCGAAINASYGLCVRCQRAGRARARAAVLAGLFAVGIPGLISTGIAAAQAEGIPGPAVGEHVSVAGYSVPGEAVPCPVIVADRPSDELATILGPGETVRIVPISDLRPAELGGGCSW